MQPKIISGETPFQVCGAHSFSVSPSESGYTLAYSNDCETFTNYSESTPANETLLVNGVPNNVFWKLVGNTSTVQISW